ncbi:MAG: mitochondrial fission ELM1 family protein [Proteobacteria bacterium]|nr:mitochondrial fission ELM1 family protein [Pseudomonadota bacterium]
MQLTACHDGRAGNARQATALAHALAGRIDECVLQPGLLARAFAPHRWPHIQHPYGAAFDALLAAPPQIAIGCGRQAALATRLLRQRGTQVAQILDPRLDPRLWNLVIVPEHDALRGENVLTLRGSLHPVDDDYLMRALSAFPALALLPEPHSVVLVGGPTRHAPMQLADLIALLRQVAACVRNETGSLSVIASRRTPPEWRQALVDIEADLPGVRWRDTGDGPNPFAGLLAYADRLVCTPDSTNMLSEAAATWAPLYLWSPDHVGGRLRKFIDGLLASGRAKPWDGAPQRFDVQPLRETARIARVVRERLLG